MLETKLAGKATKKKQNTDTPKPPWLLHAKLYGENRRAPAPPDTSSKPAWETQTNR
jgi:hypothetical protein